MVSLEWCFQTGEKTNPIGPVRSNFPYLETLLYSLRGRFAPKVYLARYRLRVKADKVRSRSTVDCPAVIELSLSRIPPFIKLVLFDLESGRSLVNGSHRPWPSVASHVVNYQSKPKSPLSGRWICNLGNDNRPSPSKKWRYSCIFALSQPQQCSPFQEQRRKIPGDRNATSVQLTSKERSQLKNARSCNFNDASKHLFSKLYIML